MFFLASLRFLLRSFYMLGFSIQLNLTSQKNWMHCHLRFLSPFLVPESSPRTAVRFAADIYWSLTASHAHFLNTEFWLTFPTLAREIGQSLCWLSPGHVHRPLHSPRTLFSVPWPRSWEFCLVRSLQDTVRQMLAWGEWVPLLIFLQADGLPPHIEDNLGWVNFDLKVKFLNISVFWIFRSCVRSGNLASFIKYIKMLLYRTRELIKRAGHWLWVPLHPLIMCPPFHENGGRKLHPWASALRLPPAAHLSGCWAHGCMDSQIIRGRFWYSNVGS